MEILAKKKNAIFTFLLVFIIYLTYTKVFTIIFGNSITISLIGDISFLFGIMILYQDILINDLKKFFKSFDLKKKLKIILGGCAVIIFINILGGFITEVLFPNQVEIDENTNALYNLEMAYTVFKTAIFAVIAEELVFRKSVRDVIDNNIVFILISSLLYALMNIAYVNFNLISIVDLVQCFLFGVVLSYIYVKTDNVIAIMLVKFAYTLIPLTIMFLGIGA
jgi:membrane protease YdiL (CAAX protease family)